jgi:1-acyl-sn-glycerol-3-phosphate acyltransferase
VAWRTVPAFVAGGLATLAGFVAVCCLGSGRADSAVTDRLVRCWAWVWLRAVGARVSVDGLEHVSSGVSYVVVSNHESNLDPIVHLRVMPFSVRAIAARELFGIVVLGRLMRMIGMIEVDRDNPNFDRIDSAASRSIAAGHSVLVYPEGRVSPDGSIREFKDGAFVIAAANQAPVLPVAIHGTRRIWPPGRPRIRRGQVRITVGQPLATINLARHDVAGLRDQAREVIASAHRDLVKSMAETSTSSPSR